jgi:hypothetical protein
MALRGRHHRLNAVKGGQVRGDESRAQPLRGLMTRGRIQIDDHHCGTFGGQPAGHRLPDPGRTPGHDSPPAPQHLRLIRCSVCHATVLRRDTDIAHPAASPSMQPIRNATENRLLAHAAGRGSPN